MGFNLLSNFILNVPLIFPNQAFGRFSYFVKIPRMVSVTSPGGVAHLTQLTCMLAWSRSELGLVNWVSIPMMQP